MTESSSYACTLTADEAPSRAEQVRVLTAGLQAREYDERTVRLRFDPGLRSVVVAFVHDEVRCCAFFGFEITDDDDAVELAVHAPAGAEALLSSLFEVFDAGEAPSA